MNRMSAVNAKRVGLTLVLLFAAQVAASAQQLITLEANELKGPVKRIREYEAEFERAGGRLVEGKRRLSSEEAYDARGRQLSRRVYTDDGELLYGDEHTYDAAGRLAETSVKHSKYVYLPDRRVYVYDAAGNVVEETAFDTQGRRLGRYVKLYDGRCRLTQSDSIAEGENQVFRGHKRTVYTLDANGRMVGEATYTIEGEALKPEDYGLGYQKQIHLYDAAGRRVITQRLTEEGRLFRTLVTRFDAKGNEVESAEYDSDGGVQSRTAYSYVFDARGNWVKQVTSQWVTRDGKSFFEPEGVSYREITYYSDLEARAAKAGAPATVRGCASDEGTRNTDSEEYAVYAAAARDMFDEKRIRLYVVGKYTSGYRTSDPEERGGLESEMNFQTAGFDREALADYVSKSRAGRFELLGGLLKLGAPHRLVTETEIEGLFARSCDVGWARFYRKYPGSQGNMTLSRVGFNKARDAAVVYLGNQSHCLAGAGYFVFLKKEGGVWRVLKKYMLWVS